MTDSSSEGDEADVKSPLDLVLILAVTLNTLIFSFQGVESPFRVGLGVLFVFVAPGYAFVSMLFPSSRKGDTDVMDGQSRSQLIAGVGSGVSFGERAVLTLGASVFIVPLVGLFINFTPTGITAFTMMAGVGALTIGLVAVAFVRRYRLPPADRYGVSVSETLSRVRAWIHTGDTTFERALAIALVVGVILGTSGLVYAVAVPKDGEQFTEFYLMTRDAETGELVADGYPSNLTQGERRVMYIGLTNREHRTIDYTVIMELQRVEVEDGSVTVLQRERLQEFETTVRHGQSWRGEHLFTPTLAGERLRLSYQLYRGELPANPTVDNAYRSVHVWVDVAPS